MTVVSKNAIVLGIHSFLDHHLKVGIQYIAEGLADAGWQVDYISRFSSPFDFYGEQRRRRMRRVWIDRQNHRGIDIRKGLKEYAFRALFPAHRGLLRYRWQIATYPPLAPSWLNKKRYAVCINDVTANIVYLPRIQTELSILRLNDLPEGFSHALSKHIIEWFRDAIRTNRYNEIWAAHAPLADYVLELNQENRVVTIPNGVEEKFLIAAIDAPRKLKTAVFIGSVEPWVDQKLLEKTASLLPDWQFDVIGPLHRPWSGKAANFRWLPPIAKATVPETLARYQVGLIPLREVAGHVAYMEKPLKFYEYIGAGLGVASTDVGALRAGMGDLASYGNTANEFAGAILREAARASQRSTATCREIIVAHCWPKVLQTMRGRLEQLQARKAVDGR